jgi:hypothetical protein
VVRTRGRDGRAIYRQPNREDHRERQEQQPVGWPGGPIDVSLLTRYEHHVSRYIWLGQVTNCLFCCYLLSYIVELSYIPVYKLDDFYCI